MKRRNFVVSVLATLTTFVPALSFAKKKKKKNKAGKMVEPGKGMALSLKYVEDKSKVEKTLQIARGGCSFAEQNCGTCILKQGDGKEMHNKKSIYGCSLFPGKKVYAEAWCQSWAKHGDYTCGKKDKKDKKAPKQG